MSSFNAGRKLPFFSLREFAVELGIKPSHLSYLLRGERGLSKAKAYKVASVLKLKAHEAEAFRFMVSAKDARSLRERNLAKQALTRKYLIVARAALEKKAAGR